MTGHRCVSSPLPVGPQPRATIDPTHASTPFADHPAEPPGLMGPRGPVLGYFYPPKRSALFTTQGHLYAAHVQPLIPRTLFHDQVPNTSQLADAKFQKAPGKQHRGLSRRPPGQVAQEDLWRAPCCSILGTQGHSAPSMSSEMLCFHLRNVGSTWYDTGALYPRCPTEHLTEHRHRQSPGCYVPLPCSWLPVSHADKETEAQREAACADASSEEQVRPRPGSKTQRLTPGSEAHMGPAWSPPSGETLSCLHGNVGTLWAGSRQLLFPTSRGLPCIQHVPMYRRTHPETHPASDHHASTGCPTVHKLSASPGGKETKKALPHLGWSAHPGHPMGHPAGSPTEASR